MHAGVLAACPFFIGYTPTFAHSQSTPLYSFSIQTRSPLSRFHLTQQVTHFPPIYIHAHTHRLTDDGVLRARPLAWPSSLPGCAQEKGAHKHLGDMGPPFQVYNSRSAQHHLLLPHCAGEQCFLPSASTTPPTTIRSTCLPCRPGCLPFTAHQLFPSTPFSAFAPSRAFLPLAL
jgi:hypothetical protein